MANVILDGLNEQQKQAVTHKTGPLLIIAGAGTGKTTVITRRVAYIIEQKLAKPSEILALTFTEKAAAEMETRIDSLVPYGYTDMWISTFHAFGDRLLRDYALDLGLPINFKVLTQTEQAIFIREHIFAFDLKHYRPVSDPLSHIQALLSHFSRLKDELITPEEYLNYINSGIQKNKNMDPRIISLGESEPRQKSKDDNIESDKQLELAKAYARYQELMMQSGNLDFGDQIFLTYKLLKENKKVLKELQYRFRYILVDEFQDTNFAQNEIIKLLAGENGNITVVGDDDQSIYRFRGASISNILDFKKTYPKTKEVVLNTNYRSTQEILDGAYKLIQENNPDRLEVQNKINKRLKSNRSGNIPELLYCSTISCEADMVVKKIIELKKSKNYSYKDFAILVRANNHAEPFMQSLNLEGIPFEFSGATSLFSQPEVKMLISFFKCLAYPDDNLAFFDLATSEFYRVNHFTLAHFYSVAKRANRSILSLIEDDNSNKEENISLEEINKLKTIILDIKKFRELINEPAGEVLYNYLSEKNYLKNLSANPTVENELKIRHVARFFDRIVNFNHSSNDRGVLKFLENLELILEVGEENINEIDPDLDAVNILTVHSAKGLEWPVVFVVNCIADRFPSRKLRDALPIPIDLVKERLPEGDFHLQEERRLFYVAVTRAKDYLFLTSADDYGGKRIKKISQFVLELLGENRPDKLKSSLSNEEKINRFKKTESLVAKIPDKFQGRVLKLSRQQIDDYFSCPKKFYFAHIIRIPLLKNQNLMYGTAVHTAIENYFSRKISDDENSLNKLLSDFKQVFTNIGFITRDQEDLRFAQGLNTLSRFYDYDLRNNLSPSKIEESFEFFDNNVKINGRYDLVFKDGKDSEIVDFKTSDVREQKEADKRIKDSMQMKIYALAWFNKFNIIPKTSLYFIESNLKGEIIFKESDLVKTEEIIFGVAEGIRKNDFVAKPTRHQCRWCAYKDICIDAI